MLPDFNQDLLEDTLKKASLHQRSTPHEMQFLSRQDIDWEQILFLSWSISFQPWPLFQASIRYSMLIFHNRKKKQQETETWH